MLQIVDFTLEQSIIHHLLLKTVGIEDYSLFNGKLGISIAFFEYGKYSKNQIYIDFADELIDNFLSKINHRMFYELSTGLSGIGWGIEYMIQKEFVEYDSNQACKDIDNMVMCVDIKRIKDWSLETGIEGILHYLLARITGSHRQNNPIPFDSLYLKNVCEVLFSIPTVEISDNLNLLIEKFNSFIDNGICDYRLDISRIIDYASFEEKDILQARLGLQRGLAGKLLNIVMNKNKE